MVMAPDSSEFDDLVRKVLEEERLLGMWKVLHGSYESPTAAEDRQAELEKAGKGGMAEWQIDGRGR